MSSEIIKRYIHQARRIGTALDLGAGHGQNASLLSAIGFQVTAVDASSEAVESLEKISWPLEIKKTKIEQLLFDQHYDIVLAINSLQFVRDPYDIIEKMQSVCDDMIFISTFADMGKQQDKRDSMNYFKLQELKQYFKDWNILLAEHFHVTEYHPPYGLHSHDCIDLVAQKKDKNRIPLSLDMYI